MGLCKFSPNILDLCSAIRKENSFLSLVNFSCMVKFSKQYLSFKGACSNNTDYKCISVIILQN